jgi:glycosyltransferase 2 family protein
LKSLFKHKHFKTVLGIGISAAIIAALYHYVEDWSKVWLEFQRMAYWPFIPVTIFFLLHFVVRAVRWRYLLEGGEGIPIIRLAEAIMVGALASNVLPLRAGEFVRPYMLTVTNRVSFTIGFISVVIERFFDLAVVLISFGVILLFVPGIPSFVYQGAISLTVMASIILIVMVGGVLFPDLIRKVSTFFFSPLPERLRKIAATLVDDFLRGSIVLNEPSRLAFVVILSALVWLTCYLQFYFFLYCFDVQPSFGLSVLTAVMVALAVAAPSAPGFIGVYQAGCVLAFSLYGVKKEAAMAYAIFTHLYQYVMILALGVLSLVRNNVKLDELRGQQSEGTRSEVESAN